MAKDPQERISFASPAPSHARVDGQYTPSVSSSAGILVSFFSATPSVCAVSEQLSTSEVVFYAAGTCTILASQAEAESAALHESEAKQSFSVGSRAGPHFARLTGSGQSPTTARQGAFAATLPSGQVLIAGGDSKTAELFNPSTESFTKLTGSDQSLTEERAGAVAATLRSGQVLIAGGMGRSIGGEGGPVQSSAEVFNPTTDTFSKLTGPGQSLTEARADAVAAVLSSGEVLIAGGVGEEEPGPLTSAELFDPATDTFSKLTGPGQRLKSQARYGAVAATLPSGQVLIAGGSAGYEGSGALSSAELFNPATDTFRMLSGSGQSLTESRAFAVAAALPSGQVLIAGGSAGFEHGGPLSSAELFNPDTDTFSKLAGPGKSLTEERAGGVAAVLPSRQVLIAGGSSREGREAPQSAELFVPGAEAAKMRVVSCRPIAKTRPRHCATKILRRLVVTLKASPVNAEARLARSGIRYAAGLLLVGNSSPRLVLHLVGHGTLKAGTYTLMLSWKTGKMTHTSRQLIRVR